MHLPCGKGVDKTGRLYGAVDVGCPHDVVTSVEGHGLGDLHGVEGTTQDDAVALAVHQLSVTLVPGHCRRIKSKIGSKWNSFFLN